MASIKRDDGPVPFVGSSSPASPQLESPTMSHTKLSARESYDEVRKTFAAIVRAGGHHISNKLLPTLRIKGSSFDLTTGVSSDGGPVYLLPQKPGVVESLLQHTKPWDIHTPTPWSEEYAQTLDRHEIATELSNFFSRYLHHNVNGELPGIIYETDWRSRPVEHSFEQAMYYREGDQKWNVDYVIESLQPSKIPHISCILLDRTPMLDDQFSRAELMTACALLGDRMRVYPNAHEVFPVTIFSMSSRNLRVVHVYYDPAAKCLVARMSQKLQLHSFGASGINLALSWMIGTPLQPVLPRMQSTVKQPMQTPTKHSIPTADQKKKSHWYK